MSGAYKAKSIEFKAANAPAGLEFSIMSGNDIFYGYGLNNEVVESGVRLDVGQSHTFTSKQVINVGDPVRIYSAVNVQELDIHNFIEYLSTLNIAEVFNSTVGTKLKKLVMGVNTATDNRRNTSLSDISGLLQAKRLEYLDISGYQNITSLDLSAHAYFKVLKAFESGLTSATFASGASVNTLELPDTMQTIYFDNLPNLGSGFSIKNFGRNVHSIFIRNCSRLNTKDFIFNWNANRLSDGASCMVTLEGISWAGVNANDLISLGSIKDAGGTLSLKGMIALVSVTQDQLNSIKRIFGDDCTTLGSELYIKAPDGVFVTGPVELLEGNSAQYSASVFSDNVGTVEYYIYNGSSEVSSYNGVTIDKATGYMTSTITGNDRTITVRVKHIPTQGAIVRGEMQVKVNRLIFPTSATISGKQLLNVIGNARYDLKINTQNVNGEYTTEWSLSGDAFEQGLVTIGAQYKDYCILNVISTPSELVTFELKATLKKGYNSQVTATVTYSIDLFIPGVIMTKKSNPKVLKICYDAGWCASQDYMTELEAQSVVSLGITFKGLSITHFEELRYFTGVTIIENSAFENCASLTSIVIPGGVTSIGSSAFSSCSSLTSITLPDSITSIDDSTFNACASLTSITIPGGVTSISNRALAYCPKLTSITLPDSIRSIGSGAFSGCSQLASINIPESVTILESSTFSSCSSLTSIIIPASITSIRIYAFDYCLNLKSIICKSGKAPDISGPFGTNTKNYTGRNTYDQGTNILYVPAGATGYDTGVWLDPLCNAEKCGFTISYTL